MDLFYACRAWREHLEQYELDSCCSGLCGAVVVHHYDERAALCQSYCLVDHCLSICLTDEAVKEETQRLVTGETRGGFLFSVLPAQKPEHDLRQKANL